MRQAQQWTTEYSNMYVWHVETYYFEIVFMSDRTWWSLLNKQVWDLTTILIEYALFLFESLLNEKPL